MKFFYIPFRFLQSNIIFEVSEWANVGDYLGNLQVESQEGVVFMLTKSQHDLHERPPILLNPSSGVVILDAPLDYEQRQSYNMTVMAMSMVGTNNILFEQYVIVSMAICIHFQTNVRILLEVIVLL